MYIEHSDFHDQLVRGLTHKMNNILSLFHGYLGLLLEDERLAPTTLDGLNRIKEGARAAGDLIERTHSLARPTSIIWREVDVSRFLQASRSAFVAALPRGIDLEMCTGDNLLPVWADTSRLRTALLELVQNAGEASPKGSRVSISVSVADEEGIRNRMRPGGNSAEQPIRWVEFAVEDAGPGIPEELQGKIFHPFFTTRGKRNAAGLGLTVAFGLMQQMNGMIRFTSRPGETVFRLLLPACAA